jgi:hypothetical protein
MLFASGAIALAIGVLCVIDRETAWFFYELDTLATRQNRPRRSRNWEQNVIRMGSLLIVLGGVAILLSAGWQPL